ncbi:nitrogen regulatory protein areA [Ilyonectria robusta]
MTAMNPTITEHDFRFPRRPDAWLAGNGNPNGHTHSVQRTHAGAPSARDIFNDFNADTSKTYSAANDSLLGSPLFPSLEDDSAHADQSIDKMQQDDPLATQSLACKSINHDVLTWASQARPLHDAQRPQRHRPVAKVVGEQHVPVGRHESRRLHLFRQRCDAHQLPFTAGAREARRQVGSFHGHSYQIPQGVVAPLRPSVRPRSSASPSCSG